MWSKYNYEYMVMVPKAKQALAEAILGKDLNTRYAWQQTVRMDEATLASNPTDVNTRFNLSVALYYLGAYQQSVAAFEQVQNQLSFRTLWYNIEPLEAYYQARRLSESLLLEQHNPQRRRPRFFGTVYIARQYATSRKATFRLQKRNSRTLSTTTSICKKQRLLSRLSRTKCVVGSWRSLLAGALRLLPAGGLSISERSPD